MKTTYLTLVLMVILSACGGGKPSEAESSPRELNPTDALVHNVATYWNEFDFSDTTWLERPRQEFEQVYAQWIDMAVVLYRQTGKSDGAAEVVKRAATNERMLTRFMEMTDKCLRDPNSPWRCEELYIPMLEQAINLPIDELQKGKYKARLDIAMMNRQGSKANDFAFVTEQGTKGHLYESKPRNTLLYFFNPGCNDCERVSEIIANDVNINHLISTNRLRVLAVYPDEDLQEWKKHRGKNPTQWVTARIVDENERDKYDLPAIPNLYLLDSAMTVVLKDADVEEIVCRLAE